MLSPLLVIMVSTMVRGRGKGQGKGKGKGNNGNGGGGAAAAAAAGVAMAVEVAGRRQQWWRRWWWSVKVVDVSVASVVVPVDVVLVLWCCHCRGGGCGICSSRSLGAAALVAEVAAK